MDDGLLALDSPGVLYDIRTDEILLADISEASLASGASGLSVEFGIVGSSSWWLAVKIGRIKIEKFVGVIYEVDGGPMGDSAILRLRGDMETKSWMAWAGFHSNLIGKLIEVSYVRVSPKLPPRPGFMVELIIQVRALQ